MGFFELNVAMSGLFAAQRGLQVTSHNITNANTVGYSRQVLTQRAASPISGMGVGMTGSGVTTIGVNRLRESYIDQKIWAQHPKTGEYNVKVQQSAMMESVFGEPSDTGFTAVFDGLFSGISQLSIEPHSHTNKIALKEEMTSFAKYYNEIAGSLATYQQDLNGNIKGVVQEINTLATRIQSLNQQIMEAELYSHEASNFRDERDNCIDRLSQLINVEVEESTYQMGNRTFSRFDVKVADQPLVEHLTCHTLELEIRKDGFYALGWDNGLAFDMQDPHLSGELKGLMDMRDGTGTDSTEGTDYRGIPYYKQRLDHYVQQFARTMNDAYSMTQDGYIQIKEYSNEALHIEQAAYVKKGSGVGDLAFYDQDKNLLGSLKKEGSTYQLITYDKLGNETYHSLDKGAYEEAMKSYTSKEALFTYTLGLSGEEAVSQEDLDYSQMTAQNFAVAYEIQQDPTTMKTLYDKSNPSDTSFMVQLLAQRDNKEMFKEGDPKDYMAAIFAELGINGQEAEMYQDTHTAVVNHLKNQRLSVSQVDITEEFTYMIQYQQAYQAAAKMMNTMDGIYETTLFKLGNF